MAQSLNLKSIESKLSTFSISKIKKLIWKAQRQIRRIKLIKQFDSNYTPDGFSCLGDKAIQLDNYKHIEIICLAEMKRRSRQ